MDHSDLANTLCKKDAWLSLDGRASVGRRLHDSSAGPASRHCARESRHANLSLWRSIHQRTVEGQGSLELQGSAQSGIEIFSSCQRLRFSRHYDVEKPGAVGL